LQNFKVWLLICSDGDVEEISPLGTWLMELDFQEKKKYKMKDIIFFWKRLICIRKENNIHKYEGTIPKKTRQIKN